MTVAGVDPETCQERKAPGRPRNAQADEAILDAVLALISEGQGAASVSIEAVAARAGVGKATIYRRWANKEALLIDAVAAMKGPIPEPAGESVRDDLVLLVTGGRTVSAQRYGKVTVCLLPDFARDEVMRNTYQAVIEPRREKMREVLRRGIASGELRPDLDIELTLLMLSAPNLVQTMLKWSPTITADNFAEHLVDAVLCGAAAR